MADQLSPRLPGWQHPTGAGIRRHFLVVPSVICAAQAARTIAESAPGALAIEHQHGCAQLGGDARLTQHVLTQLATHPNVAAALVVSLGCETVQGSALHRAIVARGQRAAFVGIQQEGGTLAAVTAGRAALAGLRERSAGDPRAGVGWADLTVGIEAGWERATGGQVRAIVGMIERLRAAGAVVIQAAPGSGDAVLSWWERRHLEAAVRAAQATPLAYAVRPGRPGLYLMESPSSRIAQKTGLAAAGAQVIVSPLAAGLPAGSPVAPVMHLGIAPYALAFREDVDVMLDERPDETAARSVLEALAAACRDETAFEAIGDFEMAIHRIGPTM